MSRTFNVRWHKQDMLLAMNKLAILDIKEREQEIKDLDFAEYLKTGKFPERGALSK